MAQDGAQMAQDGAQMTLLWLLLGLLALGLGVLALALLAHTSSRQLDGASGQSHSLLRHTESSKRVHVEDHCALLASTKATIPLRGEIIAPGAHLGNTSR